MRQAVKRLFGLALLLAVVPGTRAAEPAATTNTPAALIARLAGFDRTMDQYFRNDSVAKAKSTINIQLKQHNDWVKTYQAEFDAQSAKLKERSEALRQMQTRLHEMADKLKSQKPNRASKDNVDAYNQRVADYNALAQQYEALVPAFNKDAGDFQNRYSEFSREVEISRIRLKRTERTTTEEVGAQEKWLASTEASRFFTDLNRCYAGVRRELSVRSDDPTLQAAATKAAGMRRELADWFQARQRDDEAAHLLVEATLCRREKCYLILDTGAHSVTLSPALVEVLGLTNRLGEEVDVGLAGGLRTKGRKLSIPQLSVLGQEATDVEAVMLEEPGVGVDGLLGLTFLRRFNYRIEYGDTPQLILEPKRTIIIR